MEIIVADDDPNRSARESILQIAKAAPIELRYIESAAENISRCRNACLDAARADWIAFIDDDQTATPNWLRELIVTAEKYEADAVTSYVRGIYPPDTPNWVRAGNPYTRDYGPTGAQVSFAHTGGILFRRHLPDKPQLLFDVGLGITGGEDSEYFLRYKSIGGKVVSCKDSVVNEIVPSTRVNSQFLGMRCRRHGHINGRVIVSKQSPPRRLGLIMKSIVGVMVTSPYAAARLLHQAVAWWLFMKFWYHVGVLEWALGRKALEHE